MTPGMMPGVPRRSMPMFDFGLDDDVSIDLTPLIDVVFMLLIFFIMTTTFSKPVLDIILPVSETAEQPAERVPELVISINGEGKIFHADTELSRQDLPALLDSREGDLLNLFVDEKAPFEAFVAIVDIAKTKRGGRFVISTQSPHQSPDQAQGQSQGQSQSLEPGPSAANPMQQAGSHAR